MTDLAAMGKAAKAAGRVLATLTTDEKNRALLAIADELEAQTETVLAQNALDIEDGRKKGLSSGLLDHLLLTEAQAVGQHAAVKLGPNRVWQANDVTRVRGQTGHPRLS